MRARRLIALALIAIMAGAVLPVSASAGTDAFGRTYAGQAACLACHDGLLASDRTAYVTTRHGRMVTDVRANPTALIPPALSTTFWPSPTFGLGIRFAPANVYLQVGGGPIKEYVTTFGETLPAASGVATVPVPSSTPLDDLALFDGITFDTDLNEWEVEGVVSVRGYYQRCGGCHNLGVTRPSSDTATLPNGSTISPTTATSVQGMSIQCEICHGTGSTTTMHETSPEVLAWKSSNVAPGRLLSAEVCGQCHATGTAKQHMYKSSTAYFSSPTGYTPDETLSGYFDVVTEVPTEASFTVNPTAYRFYPSGANRNMNHVYYNEWLNNKAANGFGHIAPTNTSVKRSGGKCLGCHSGEGFLERIGDPVVPTDYNVATSTVMAGISCQICHSSHDPERGLSLRQSNDPDVGVVDCGDCHNWQFEVLGQQVPDASAFATGYAGMTVRHPQREMLAGAGLIGVPGLGQFMPDAECADCHMPETRAGRVSHRFHVMTPGDAEEWGVPEGGDSCTPCHPSTARDDLQLSIDGWQGETGSLIAQAKTAMTAARSRLGWTGTESALIATSSVDPDVINYKKAYHNYSFVNNDASAGAHNPPYAQAGLEYALHLARAIRGSISLNGPSAGTFGTDIAVVGSVLMGDGTAAVGERVELQARKVGDADFATVALADTNGLGAYSAAYRLTERTELRAVWMCEGTERFSPVMVVEIGSYGGVTPVDRASGTTRFATAVAASRDFFSADSVANVVLASGASFADALSANGLAGVAASPLLLTAPTQLPAETLAEIERIAQHSPEASATVWIVGGENAVGAGVEDSLIASGFAVERLAGTSRYDTARLVAATVVDLLGTSYTGEAFVVNGRAFPDGLSVGPVAYASGMPVLLTEAGSLPAPTAAALTDSGITWCAVVGGTGAVSESVLASLPAGSERVAAGTDRYSTAVEFARWAYGEGYAGLGVVGIASGAAFPDALAAGAPIGAGGGVLLLTRPEALPGSVDAFLMEYAGQIGRAVIFGGTGAVSDTVRSSIYDCLN